MKTVLKHTAFATAVALAVIASQLSHAESVRADTVTEQRRVTAFTSIELSGPYRVAIRADIVVRGPGSAAVNVKETAAARAARLERGTMLVVDRSGSRHVSE
jgi:hypothetical protein